MQVFVYSGCIAMALTGCNSFQPGSFNTSDFDYSKLVKDSKINEVRVFQAARNDENCPLQSEQETLAPLVVSALGYVAKEVIAYGKSELEKRAQYLESDIILNGRTLLTNSWPAPTSNRLCLLIIAGEYSTSSSGDVQLAKFRDSETPNLELPELKKVLSSYKVNIPGATAITGPFSNLSKDPSFLIELSVTTKKIAEDKWIYRVTPTYMLYPNPLHKMSKNGLERKLSIDFTMGTTTGSISLDGFKSGAVYTGNQMKTRYSISDSAGAPAFSDITVKVTEGPDKMPTAKILRDIAAQDQTIQKYIDEKLKESTNKKP